MCIANTCSRYKIENGWLNVDCDLSKMFWMQLVDRCTYCTWIAYRRGRLVSLQLQSSLLLYMQLLHDVSMSVTMTSSADVSPVGPGSPLGPRSPFSPFRPGQWDKPVVNPTSVSTVGLKIGIVHKRPTAIKRQNNLFLKIVWFQLYISVLYSRHWL